MKQFLYIILILLLLYYFTYSYKNIDCFNVGIQCRHMVDSCLPLTPSKCKQSYTKIAGGANVKCEGKILCTPSTDSCDGSCHCPPPSPYVPPPAPPPSLPCTGEDCDFNGYASGYRPPFGNCICACFDGWTGPKCTSRTGAKPVFPDKIERLPWPTEQTYISLGTKPFTNRYMFLLSRVLEPNDYINIPISSYNSTGASHAADLYNLAQYGFVNITFERVCKSCVDPAEVDTPFKVGITLNLHNDNIPGGIDYNKTYTLYIVFHARMFFDQHDFNNNNNVCNYFTAGFTISVNMKEHFIGDTITYVGTRMFGGMLGEDPPECPSMDHRDSPEEQEADCITKDFCKFTHNSVLSNTCDNKCIVWDTMVNSNTFFLELYQVRINFKARIN